MIDWCSKVVGPLVDKFGQPATLMQAGSSYNLNGVFDEAYTNVDVVDGMPVTTKTPCFGFAVANLSTTPKQKDKLFIAAVYEAPKVDTTYIIKEVQADGHGWCRLLLNIAQQ